jgi:hypothetical protein
LDPYAIKLVGPSEDIGRALIGWYRQRDAATPAAQRGPRPGDLWLASLNDAFIYPASLFAAPAAPTA